MPEWRSKLKLLVNINQDGWEKGVVVYQLVLS
jgi:hypothetical protein